MGKPTSDELLKLEKLKEFQKANPGLDFVSGPWDWLMAVKCQDALATKCMTDTSAMVNERGPTGDSASLEKLRLGFGRFTKYWLHNLSASKYRPRRRSLSVGGLDTFQSWAPLVSCSF